MRPDRVIGVLAAGLLSLATACDDDATVQPPSPVGQGGAGGMTTVVNPGGGTADPGPPTSPKANVKFKDGRRLRLELARALELNTATMCLELGQFDCFPLHRVVLGSPDAFFTGLYEKLPDTTTSTPLAVDRVVLSACAQRVDLDLQAGQASPVLFGGLDIDGDGKLADLSASSVDDAITSLYRRALSRDPKAAEVGHLRDLYTAVDGAGTSTAPARDWAVLSCFAVMTSMEMLFY